MLRAVQTGLTLQDFEVLTLGMILDYLLAVRRDQGGDSEREATQSDFDRF